MVFNDVVLGSGTASVTIAVGSLNYLSVHNVQMIAAQQMDETETLLGTLSGMCALDYVYENTIKSGVSIANAQFRWISMKARQSKNVTRKEMDLFFEALDRLKDCEPNNNEDLREYKTISLSRTMDGKR
jgi:hypothetical protein